MRNLLRRSRPAADRHHPGQPATTGGRHEPRRLGGRGSALAAAAALATAVPLLQIAPAAAAARVVTISPGANVAGALAGLRAGDTLRLQPGTYAMGLVRFDRAKGWSTGTASAPITVKAADPAHPPLLQGELKLWDPSYWVLDGLRVQATVSGGEALYLGGGTGWTVRNSEFFGARSTGAYSNVAIAVDAAYGTGGPRAFSFTGNCVHGAAVNPAHAKGSDHNVYVSFAGSSATGGSISRNVIFDAPHGAGVKLGNGGALNALGPWNVKLSYNTISDDQFAVLMHGNVRNNSLTQNLLARSRSSFTSDTRTTLIYLNNVVGGGNATSQTYGAPASMFTFGSGLSVGSGAGLRPDPKFASTGSCSAYRPAYAPAQAYGRWAAAPVQRTAPQPLLGDWNGDGVADPGWYDNGKVSLSTPTGVVRYSFGTAGDVAVVGDWDGDHKDSVGVFRAGHWYLRNELSTGPAEVSFGFGTRGDRPVVGAWTAGRTGVGVVRGNQWFIRNGLATAPADASFALGSSTDVPVAGDWDGDGVAGPGVRRGSSWYLAPTVAQHAATVLVGFGSGSDRPVVATSSRGAFPAVVRSTRFLWREDLLGGVATRDVTFAG